MKIICTTCSAAKDPDPNPIPAFKRYISARIAEVQTIAQKEKTPFWILSGEYGLIHSSQLINYYDHLLVDSEVEQLADRVSKQLLENNISEIVFFHNFTPI